MKKLLYLLLLLVPAGLLAQDVKQYSFTHYGTGAGLLSNEVTSVHQDADGYIWIGTNNGLQRFDGVRYMSFRHESNNPASLPNNYIVQIMRDSDGILWILCGNNKICKLDPRRFIFTQLTVKFSSPHSYQSTKRLVSDEEGNIFLVCGAVEYLTLNREKDEFSSEKNPFEVPKSWNIISIAQQPGTSKYWIGCWQGFAIYNSKTKKLSYNGNNLEREPLLDKIDTTTAVYNLFFDRQGRLWFDRWGAGSPVISSYDVINKKLIMDQYSLMPFIRTYHETGGYVQQKDGSIWIKGLNVLAKFVEKDRKFQMVYNGYLNEQSIVYESVTELAEDRENNLWVTTSNNGLYRFAPAEQFFINIRHQNIETGLPGRGGVMAFQMLNNGTMLASTWGDGVFRYDKNLNEIPRNIPGLAPINRVGPSVWDMCLSRDSNTVWMGAQPGIYAYNQKTNRAIFYNPPLLRERTVRQVEEDRFGNLWIGTQSIGVFKWNAVKGKDNFDAGLTQVKGVPTGQIVKIFEDRHGFIWIATSGNGVYVLDPATDKVVLEFNAKTPDGNPSPTSDVITIAEYDDTTMVLAGGTRVHLFNRITKSMRAVGSGDFLNGSICAVEKDERSGYLWVSTTHGLHRVNIKNNIFVHFDRVDGITDDRFVGGSSLKLPDGRIAFGADNQFTVFNPAAVRINNSSPVVRITGFKMMGTPLLVDSLLSLKRVELGPKQNSITIDFSGLSFNTAYLIRYKLEGMDDNWKKADNSFQAVYSYLPAGTYTFLAKSEDADGKEGSTITRLVIKVHPAFWQAWWFYGLIVLFGSSILYLIDRERIKRLNDLQKMRTEIATNLHEDVTTTLSNINLLGEMAKIKADKDIDRSKEYIDQISTKSHNMIIAMDDILWSIDPHNDSMEKTLLRMLEFTDALKHRHGAVIELALDKKVRSLKLDMKTRHEFFLIFKEGLRMIIQYAGGRNTLINIDLFRNKLSLRLQDSTARLDTHIAEIEGIIKEINSRAASVNAESDIQYDRNGMAIILLIPVR